LATAYSKANRAIRSDAARGDDLDALRGVAARPVLDAGVESSVFSRTMTRSTSS
jgi:hypothetical protein